MDPAVWIQLIVKKPPLSLTLIARPCRDSGPFVEWADIVVVCRGQSDRAPLKRMRKAL